MKARPILFSGPMVQALLAGRKTQTRRVVKPQPGDHHSDEGFGVMHRNPYGQPGDLLCVRESLRLFKTVHIETAETGLAAYWKAGGGDMQTWEWTGRSDVETIPSIHMPRRFSRLTLEITDVRVERLQDISAADALAEGIVNYGQAPAGHDLFAHWGALRRTADGLAAAINSISRDPEGAFQRLWESINGAKSWEANPWVWVIEFKVHHCNVDELLRQRGAV